MLIFYFFKFIFIIFDIECFLASVVESNIFKKISFFLVYIDSSFYHINQNGNFSQPFFAISDGLTFAIENNEKNISLILKNSKLPYIFPKLNSYKFNLNIR